MQILSRAGHCTTLRRATVWHPTAARRPLSSFRRAMGDTESIRCYCPGWFHPVHLGDVLQDRYSMLRKLGYGRYGTVWLAKDESMKRYVALKIKAAWSSGSARAESLHLKTLSQQSDSASTPIATLLDSFSFKGPNGTHDVLVLQPLGRTLGDLIQSIDSYEPNGFWLPTNTVRAMARRMVAAVDHIHSREIMHCDIHPGNFIFALNTSIDHIEPQNIEQSFRWHLPEYIFPLEVPWGDLSSPRDGIPAYLVEPMPLENDPRALTADRLQLSDFGAAVTFASLDDKDAAYPKDARTPEEVLGLPISPSADIWALGCTIFHVVMLGGPFFVDSFAKGQAQDDEHLESMINVLGPMPKFLHERWEDCANVLDEYGCLLPEQAADPFSDSLRHQISVYKPKDMSADDAISFEDLMRTIFQWEPDKRPTARQLLQHPWLQIHD